MGPVGPFQAGQAPKEVPFFIEKSKSGIRPPEKSPLIEALEALAPRCVTFTSAFPLTSGVRC
jgi:hypothetical protein